MTYGIGITFPAEPSKEDIKKLKRDIAYSMFGVVDGGKVNGIAGKPGKTDKPKRDDDHCNTE